MGQVADKAGILTDRNPQGLRITCGWQVVSGGEPLTLCQKTPECQRALTLIEHELDMTLKYPTPSKPMTRMLANLGSAR